MSNFSPREIVSELDRFIVGQNDAKRAVAVALRNRWRRQQLPPAMRDEIVPKNILMIGPTGVGKTEIARRLARLADAPFIKIEATKFTEVGYVGRDVDSIIRDLTETALLMVREKLRREVAAKADLAAEERVLDAMVGKTAQDSTRAAFRKRLRGGELDDREIEIEVQDNQPATPTFDIPGMPGGSVGMINLGEMLGKAMGGRTKSLRLTTKQAQQTLAGEEAEKLLDQERVTREAIELVEQSGIVFLDEIDKIAARSEFRGGDVSRDGLHPVHRLRRLPFGKALGPPARTAGPASDPRRAQTSRSRRPEAHSRRAGGKPHQAIHGAYVDRGGDPGVHRRRHRRSGAAVGGDQRHHREYRRPTVAHGARAPARRGQLHRQRSRRSNDRGRRRDGARPGWRPGRECRSVEVHPVRRRRDLFAVDGLQNAAGRVLETEHRVGGRRFRSTEPIGNDRPRALSMRVRVFVDLGPVGFRHNVHRLPERGDHFGFIRLPGLEIRECVRIHEHDIGRAGGQREQQDKRGGGPRHNFIHTVQTGKSCAKGAQEATAALGAEAVLSLAAKYDIQGAVTAMPKMGRRYGEDSRPEGRRRQPRRGIPAKNAAALARRALAGYDQQKAPACPYRHVEKAHQGAERGMLIHPMQVDPSVDGYLAAPQSRRGRAIDLLDERRRNPPGGRGRGGWGNGRGQNGRDRFIDRSATAPSPRIAHRGQPQRLLFFRGRAPH
jgi:hypothetical protein